MSPIPLRPVRYLVVSDIHLGKRSVPARELIQQLKSFFSEFQPHTPISELDILFIAGDLFDQAMSFTSDDIVLILEFMRTLMRWCAYHRVRLRILEGTPSHDRGQPKNLAPMAKSIEDLDFAYIATMCVESMEDLGVTVLYVPDEYAGSAEKAQTLIDQELTRLKLQQVTLAIVHGMCRYQMPEITSTRWKYDEQFFLDRVWGYINIGHVHIPSTYSRILAQGSFGRLAHGEEHAKGAYLLHIDPSGENQHFFLENREATTFKTVKITFKDVEKASDQLRKHISELRDYSHVRVKASKGHAIFNVLDTFKQDFSTLFFTKITDEEADQPPKLIDDRLLSADYVPIHLHKDNIVPMIMEKVKEHPEMGGSSITRLERKLLELR